MKTTTDGLENLKRAAIQRLRILLGIAQMAGVVCTVTLLIRSGVNTVSLISAMVTCLLTTISVLLFGSHRSRGRDTSWQVRRH